MMIKTFFLMVLCKMICCLYEKNEVLVRLTPTNFDEMVTKSSDMWLVEFFSSSCPHSIAFAPKFERAASELNNTCKVGVVDFNGEGKYLMYRFNVKYIPSFKIFHPYESHPEDYNGPRTPEDLVNRVRDSKKLYKRDGQSKVILDW